MDHICYLDYKSKELELVLNGEKTMIIRGATGRKMPYGRVNKGDVLYLINNNAQGQVQAKGIVSAVFNSEKMDQQESKNLVDKINKSALLVYETLGCKDLARVDFILSDGIPYFLEINTIPGMTNTSLIPDAMKYLGVSLADVLDELIREQI